MKSVVNDMHLLQSHAPAMDSVFRIGELAVQLLESICRGLYGTEGWTLDRCPNTMPTDP